MKILIFALVIYGLFALRLGYVRFIAKDSCSVIEERLPIVSPNEKIELVHITARSPEEIGDRQHIHKNFPGVKIVYWSDEMMKNMVETKYPELLYILNGLPVKITQIDFLRTVVIYDQGGMFLDNDLLVLKPFQDRLPKNRVSMIQSSQPVFLGGVHHSIIVSPPRHVFWNKTWEILYEHIQSEGGTLKISGNVFKDIFNITSAYMFFRAEEQMNTDQKVIKLPYSSFEPLVWTNNHPMFYLNGLFQIKTLETIYQNPDCIFTVHVAQGTYLSIFSFLAEWLGFLLILTYIIITTLFLARIVMNKRFRKKLCITVFPQYK